MKYDIGLTANVNAVVDLEVDDKNNVIDLSVPTNGRIIEGGYYMPSVLDGVLSWTASKSNMPAVNSAVLDVNLSDADVICRYRGTVATYDNLPETATVGDIYDITTTGENYIWTGDSWDAFYEKQYTIASNFDIASLF